MCNGMSIHGRGDSLGIDLAIPPLTPGVVPAWRRAHEPRSFIVRLQHIAFMSQQARLYQAARVV